MRLSSACPPPYAGSVPKYAASVQNYAVSVQNYARSVPKYAVPVKQNAVSMQKYARSVPKYAVPVQKYAVSVQNKGCSVSVPHITYHYPSTRYASTAHRVSQSQHTPSQYRTFAYLPARRRPRAWLSAPQSCSPAPHTARALKTNPPKKKTEMGASKNIYQTATAATAATTMKMENGDGRRGG
eukprot:610008-Rhodomonas_salina.1